MIPYKYSDRMVEDTTGRKLNIEFDGGSFANDQIDFESMEIKESLCSESTLRFGCCEVSSFKIRVLNNVIPLKGKELAVSYVLKNGEDTPFVFGSYKVNSDKPTADRKYRDIVAYDAMHDVISADVASWYNGLTFPMPLKQFRDSFFAHFGILQVPVELVNDGMIVEKTIEPDKLSGKAVITSICELNGCFGHINRDGKFEYKFLIDITSGLYPADDLYPRNDLYPRDSNTELISTSRYYKCKYEDYTVHKISKLQMRQEEDDIGAIVGTGDNCYVIEDNFLVYGKSAADLATIASNTFSIISKVHYRPFEATAKGNPCIEVGDAVILHTKYAVIETYVLERTLKGIQALNDTYSADGEEYCRTDVNSVHNQIIQLKGKTNTLVRTVEETRLEINDIEKGLSSQITQTVEKIETEVQRATEAEVNLSTRISQTAENIAAEVTRATGAESSLSSKISLTVESIASEVTRATGAESSLSSRITQAAESITSEVTRAKGVESSLSSRINQTAESIELKVSKGDVTSQLNIESGLVELKSNRFVLEATNCSISKEGKITAKDVDLTGNITADSGKIGGLEIESKGFKYGKTSINDGSTGIYVGTDGLAIGYGGLVSSAFKVTSSGDVRIGSSGGLEIESSDAIVCTASSAYIRGSVATDYKLRFESRKCYVYASNSILGKYGGYIGFFGDDGSARKTVSVIATTSSATAATNATKINELINALKAYNLIG